MPKISILLIVSFAMFMEAVDTTVINTAIPSMSQSLQVNPLDLKLALISYLLSLAIFIPISGWVGDKFGVKKVFILAIGVFTLSSIWCGFTHNLYELIMARIVQGMGGSLTLPVGRLIIIRTFERKELIAKMSIVVMVASLGMMLGPVLGGVITNYFTWRWIFWVNAPVGFLTMLMSIYLLPAMPARPVPPLDKLGFILFGSGLATLTFGLSRFSESQVSTSHSWLLIEISITLLVLYTWHSYKRPHPIVKIDLLRERTFRVSVMGNLFARLGFGGVPFLIPLFLQMSLGFSPQLSGLLLAPTALGVMFIKTFSLPVLRFFGYKKLLLLNTFLLSISLWSFSTIDQSTSLYSIAFSTFVYGFLISLQYTGMNSLAYANISQANLSAATSIMSTIQQLAQSFGVAVAAILVRYFSIAYSTDTVLSAKIFHLSFIAMSVMTFLSALIFIQMKKEDGQELI